MSKHPDKLEFYIGGYMGTSYQVTYGDSVLTYRQSCREEVLDSQMVEPSDQQWMEFRRSVDSSGVWNWKQEYPNPGVLDGTGWSLLLEYSDQKITVSGDNNFPKHDGSPNGSPSTSRAMEQFCKGLSELLGGLEIE